MSEFEEPKRLHFLGARIDELSFKGHNLADLVDSLDVLIDKMKRFGLDENKVRPFYNYISGELLDNETELEVVKSDMRELARDSE